VFSIKNKHELLEFSRVIRYIRMQIPFYWSIKLDLKIIL